MLKRLFKRLPVVLAASLAMGLIVAVILIASFDANRYKSEIVQLGRNLSGRDFAIRGAIRLKPALTPTLVVDGVSLGNAAGMQPPHMLEIAHFEARVGLLALLRHRIDIRQLVLDGVTLVLARDDEGRGNWALGEATPTDSAGAGPPLAVDLALVSVRNARVEFHPPRGAPRVIDAERIDFVPDRDGGPLRARATLALDGEPLELAAEIAPLSLLFANAPYAFDLRANLGDLRGEVTGTIATPLDFRGLDAELELSIASVETLTRLLGGRLADLNRVALKGHLRDAGDTYRLEAFTLVAGPSSVTGTLALHFGEERPVVTATLDSDYIDLIGLGDDGDDASARVFSPAPLPFEYLRALDVTLEARIARVEFTQARLESVHVAATLADGALEIGEFSALIDGGALTATLQVGNVRKPPRIRSELSLTDVPLAALLGRKAAHQVRGGRVDAKFSAVGSGVSPAALAASATGEAYLALSDVEIINSRVELGSSDLLLGALDLLNPLSAHDPRSTMECAVFKFPLTAGRLEAATGIGIRTRKLNILGGGSLDLGSEQIDLGVDAKPREGVGLNLAGFADFVRVGGTLSAPAATTDAAGVATAGVKVGAAVATGGLSVLAEGLLDRAEGDLDVCAIARGEQPAPGSVTARFGSAVKQAAGSTGAAIKRGAAAIGSGIKNLFE